jgi:CobQ-like glutamine amidotransferase family enzyme
VLAGSVLGTRLHGPLLALNPELADLVLARALGRDEPWPTLESPAIERARRERIAEVRRETPAAGWRGRLPAGVAKLLPR